MSPASSATFGVVQSLNSTTFDVEALGLGLPGRHVGGVAVGSGNGTDLQALRPGGQRLEEEYAEDERRGGEVMQDLHRVELWRATARSSQGRV